MSRVGFLLNHDAIHQVMHSIPAAFELAHHYPGIEVVIVNTTPEEAETVATIAADYPGTTCNFETAPPPAYARLFDKLTGNTLPAKRLGVLWHHRKLFKTFDALVVPEKTSLMLKRWLGNDCPLLINIRHGAGDRACGNLSKAMTNFDLHLLPGPKYEASLLASNIAGPDGYTVTGYMKLDRFRNAPAPRLFSNERPTVWYAPHFDPGLSSWYSWGRSVLEYFIYSKDYNLVFAPHILLFRRRWHFSFEGGMLRRTPAVPETARLAGNILIDTGSIASVDMTYARASDIYLGDVSSQVYEFLYRPRPCIFLNPGRINWRGDDHFRFWRTGEVIDSLGELGPALERAVADPQRYRTEQERAFAEAFDLSDTPSARRAADAIARFLDVKANRKATL